jgi:perosamine synthetase
MKNTKESFDREISNLDKIFLGKSKRLHDPFFFGNEIKYLTNCIKSSFVSSVGNYVYQFEKKICSITGAKYSIATSSGTAALHLALEYLKVDKNDEILIPSFTYVATANAIKYCNASINFLDIENNNLGICPVKLKNYLQKISIKKGKYFFNKFSKKKIKALIVVHVYGFPSKIIEIKKICKKYNIHLIEDAAEAMGSKFKKKHLGTFGEIGILSFNGNKSITSGSGGAIICNSKKTYNYINHLATQAKIKKKYDHIHNEIGFNYRMNNLSAAVGCAQLENLKKIIFLKRENFKKYFNIFKETKNVEIIREPKNSVTNYWLIIIKFKRIKDKKVFIRKLQKKNYGMRYTWRPLHTLKIFKNCQSDKLNNSEKFFKQTLNLPSSPIISFKK